MPESCFTNIRTKEKLNEAINIKTVPYSMGIYPGRIMINIPTKPTNNAAILWKRIISFKRITAKIVVNRGVVNPRAVAFSNCIIPKAENQQIIEIILIMLL